MESLSGCEAVHLHSSRWLVIRCGSMLRSWYVEGVFGLGEWVCEKRIEDCMLLVSEWIC